MIRPYLGRPSQYGFEFHFGVESLPEGGAIVYNGIDGCIWARLPANKNWNGYDFAILDACKLCHGFNGHLAVDVVGIDATA